MNEMQNKLLNILAWFHGICEREDLHYSMQMFSLHLLSVTLNVG